MIDSPEVLNLSVQLDLPPTPILLRQFAASLRARAEEIDRILDGPGAPPAVAVETMGGGLTCPRCGSDVRCPECEGRAP